MKLRISLAANHEEGQESCPVVSWLFRSLVELKRWSGRTDGIVWSSIDLTELAFAVAVVISLIVKPQDTYGVATHDSSCYIRMLAQSI